MQPPAPRPVIAAVLLLALLACWIEVAHSQEQENAAEVVSAAAADNAGAANRSTPTMAGWGNGTIDPDILARIPPLNESAVSIGNFVPGPMRSRTKADGTIVAGPVSKVTAARAILSQDRVFGGYCIVTGSVDACVRSTSNRFLLCIQRDANMVLYDSGRAYWATNTYGRSASQPMKMCMQNDNNFVVYDGKNRALWASNTVGSRSGGKLAIIQNDGNFVLYAGCRAYWASNTMRAGAVSPPC